MWNPEARDSSPIICTFMSSWERTKMPPLPGRRGTRRREPLLDWTSWSGFRCGAITLVKSPLPHSHGRRGTRCRRRAAWKKGNKEYQSDQIHCGGGARFGPWGVREIYAASPDGFSVGLPFAWVYVYIYNSWVLPGCRVTLTQCLYCLSREAKCETNGVFWGPRGWYIFFE